MSGVINKKNAKRRQSIIIIYIKNGKRFSYPTEKAVVAEELATLRKDDNVSAVWLDGKRKK